MHRKIRNDKSDQLYEKHVYFQITQITASACKERTSGIDRWIDR